MRRWLLLFTLTVSLLCTASLAAAQGAEEAQGQAAEKAGNMRGAVTHYVAALQSAAEGSEADQRLREKIITLVRKLNPRPAIPDEATRFAVRGKTAVADAKLPAEFVEAAKEYVKAMRLAPWWPEGYFNLGVVQEKAGQLAESVRSLRLYLLAAPEAEDVASVKERIYALEYRLEKSQQETAAKSAADARLRAEEEQRARAEAEAQRRMAQLEGNWRDSVGSIYVFQLDGNRFTITRVNGCWTVPSVSYANCTNLHPENTVVQSGTIVNGQLSGVAALEHATTSWFTMVDGRWLPCPPVPAGMYPFNKSEIGPNGTYLKLFYSIHTSEARCSMEFTPEYRRQP